LFLLYHLNIQQLSQYAVKDKIETG
jgi:hypothetical protein